MPVSYDESSIHQAISGHHHYQAIIIDIYIYTKVESVIKHTKVQNSLNFIQNSLFRPSQQISFMCAHVYMLARVPCGSGLEFYHSGSLLGSLLVVKGD